MCTGAMCIPLWRWTYSPTVEECVTRERTALAGTIDAVATLCIGLEETGDMHKAELARTARQREQPGARKAAALRVVKCAKELERMRSQCERLRDVDRQLLAVQTNAALYNAMQAAVRCLVRLNHPNTRLHTMSNRFVREMQHMKDRDHTLQDALDEAGELDDDDEADSDLEDENVEADRLAAAADDHLILAAPAPPTGLRPLEQAQPL